jgi:hypothetical protein
MYMAVESSRQSCSCWHVPVWLQNKQQQLLPHTASLHPLTALLMFMVRPNLYTVAKSGTLPGWLKTHSCSCGGCTLTHHAADVDDAAPLLPCSEQRDEGLTGGNCTHEVDFKHVPATFSKHEHDTQKLTDLHEEQSEAELDDCRRLIRLIAVQLLFAVHLTESESLL